MIHMMENDSSHCSYFSPSFRNLRHIPMNPGKRARSPEGDEGPGDRPLKRPSLAIGEFNRRHLSHSSANSSRQGSEDWVQRAGGLTIDSPIYQPSDPHKPFLPQEEQAALGSNSEGGEEGDVDMAMDSEENGGMQDSPEEGRPQLAHLHTSLFNSHSDPGLQQQEQQQQYPPPQHAPHRHPYATRYSEKMQATAMPPLINVLPATPVNTMHPSHQQYHGGGGGGGLGYPTPQRPSTPPSFSPVPMVISPANSYAQLASHSKRRVVFGPRANCEKCRLGVPGHFTHY
ncbi:hypothetical protein BDZ97DRAFT_1839798, partial [Flammula alnicola]